jgi:hypothetical protein
MFEANDQIKKNLLQNSSQWLKTNLNFEDFKIFPKKQQNYPFILADSRYYFISFYFKVLSMNVLGI